MRNGPEAHRRFLEIGAMLKSKHDKTTASATKAAINLKNSNPSPDTVSATNRLIQATVHITQLEDDSQWLLAMQLVPGVTKDMMIAIYEARNHVRDGTPTPKPRSTPPPPEGSPEYLEQLVATSDDPGAEFQARYDESITLRDNLHTRMDDSENALYAHLNLLGVTDERTTELVEALRENAGDFGVQAADSRWAVVFAGHKYVAESTVSEGWDIIEEQRAEEQGQD